MMSALKDYGIDFTLADSCGVTPLHEACKHNNESAISWLLEQDHYQIRTNVSPRDSWGRTPLHWAFWQHLLHPSFNLLSREDLEAAGASMVWLLLLVAE